MEYAKKNKGFFRGIGSNYPPKKKVAKVAKVAHEENVAKVANVAHGFLRMAEEKEVEELISRMVYKERGGTI